MADSTENEAGEDEVKRRFREALERKRAASANRGRSGNGAGKVKGVHERADHQRQFRRKSG
ncbi:DUF5302 domain-containing protein [Spirillospora sp. NPDC052269]|uniref:DUF5302 domain-containing protein n=1 Tax=Actinomadura oligospora TaxID=111804 RepID=UPI000478D65D|nr:DUF5302 domain-containing protein [Actinomadura oligospora]